MPEDPTLFTPVTVVSLLACAAQFAVGFILAQIWGKKCSSTDRWVLVWLFYDAIVHITLVSRCVSDFGTGNIEEIIIYSQLCARLVLQEGPFVYMSLVGTVATSDGIFAELCKSYIACFVVSCLHYTFFKLS